ncbi:RagB/SusD family nutrient uptake outer membrane protein [Parabacteroides sp. OttesenSCG-928-O15]|nr:RagB/SusD family nutrient uptake outer membrane protein [Parabacteroides sp. OttesenSCG-928-O15]
MKTNKIWISLCLGALMLTGCDSFLNLEPLDSQTEAIYFKNPEHFVQAANALHTNVYGWQANGGNANANNTYALIFDYGTDLIGAGNDALSGTNVAGTTDIYWNQFYSWLRQVNQLIAKADEYSNPSEIAGPVGQAYFFRAWNHFMLLKRFGGVPIANAVTDTDSEIVWGPRASRYEVTKQIIDDLDVAIAKLANTTVNLTNNDGHVTLEAAKAFKARVCLFAGTWDKYVGTKTDGDGTSTGAGSSKPSGYPSPTEFFTMAKNLSKEVIDCGEFELWTGVESVDGTSVANPEMYAHTSYYYLFNLEGGESNPVGLSKSSNKEAVYRSVFDASNRRGNMNLTHSWPAGMTRKLADMYLCTDGLPVHLSPLFKGYTEMNAELENRDYRLTACVTKTMDYAWGWGMYGTGAQYGVDIYSLAAGTYQAIPDMRNGGGGMGGRKFRSESASVTAAGMESADYMQIRFAEVLLIYAEATCELGEGQISDSDLDYSINKVRARGGVAPLNAALIAKAKSLGGELTFLGEIRRERATELYGEGHRLSDLCRWGIAEAELGGQPRCGAYVSYEGKASYLQSMINPIDDKPVYEANSYVGKITTAEIKYTYAGLTPVKPGAVIIEQANNRLFSQKNYLQPIPTDQITLNPNLTQNPGW